jgi:quercetin dioxygenase-like cupin family protein
MITQTRWIGRVLVTACVVEAGCHAPSPHSLNDTSHGDAPPARVAFVHALPPLDGGQLEVRVVEVTYPPGGADAPHSHPCPVVGYVLEGMLRMRTEGGPEVMYGVGDSFYEPPNSVHLVSANASRERRARFLASFTCDRDTVLTVPAPHARPTE